MHTINLVHLDIKPANIAFSPRFNKWVFIDFGLSRFIREEFLKSTLIFFVGTYNSLLTNILVLK